jgi:hypothetical protein
MKKIVALFTLSIVLSLAAEAKGTLLYRVQVGSYKRAETPKDIKKIDELKKYLLPEGYYCFFKGGYYNFFEGANRALEGVKAIGYNKALIRVYRDQKLLSYKEGEKFIMMETYNPTPIPSNEKIDKQIFSIDQKRTFENRIWLYKEITAQETYTPGMDSVVVEKEKFKLSSLWKRKKKEKGEKDKNEEPEYYIFSLNEINII